MSFLRVTNWEAGSSVANTQTEDLRFGPDAVTVLPPHGKVELVTHNASDLDVVDAARVSFGKQAVAAEGGGVQPGDAKLIEWLIKNEHGTPLEHTFFKFRVRAPIFVFREWHRHRIGISINEESGRYIQLDPDFWYPTPDAVRKQVGKPGNYSYESVGNDLIDPHAPLPKLGELNGTHGAHVVDRLNHAYMTAYSIYEQLLEEGYAKEVARACLPVGLYSTMIWSCNARSLMAFFILRSAPDAQREIREYSLEMEKIFAKIMPATYAAFELSRVNPDDFWKKEIELLKKKYELLRDSGRLDVMSSQDLAALVADNLDELMNPR